MSTQINFHMGNSSVDKMSGISVSTIAEQQHQLHSTMSLLQAFGYTSVLEAPASV